MIPCDFTEQFWQNSNPKVLWVKVYKDYSLKDLIVTYSNNDLAFEGFSLNEKLMTDNQLTFGGCYSSKVILNFVHDIDNNIEVGSVISIQGEIFNTGDTYELGTYVVDSVAKTGETTRQVIGYDYLSYGDDIGFWSLEPEHWKTITSLGEFIRTIISQACRLTYSDLELHKLNTDNYYFNAEKFMPVLSQMSPRQVLRYYMEINGVFGYVSRKNEKPTFTYRYLPTKEYVSEVYPGLRFSDAKFNNEQTKNMDAVVYNSDWTENGQWKGAYGNSFDNVYSIIGNPFTQFYIDDFGGCSVAENLYKTSVSKDTSYYYGSANNLKGCPYIELGDFVGVQYGERQQGATFFVFERTLTGIQSLHDSFKANGSVKRENNFNTTVSQFQRIEENKVSKETDKYSITDSGYFKSEAADIPFQHTSPKTNNQLSFGVGSGGNNRGIYDNTYGEWMFYRTTSGDENINTSPTKLRANDGLQVMQNGKTAPGWIKAIIPGSKVINAIGTAHTSRPFMSLADIQKYCPNATNNNIHISVSNGDGGTNSAIVSGCIFYSSITYDGTTYKDHYFIGLSENNAKAIRINYVIYVF